MRASLGFGMFLCFGFGISRVTIYIYYDDRLVSHPQIDLQTVQDLLVREFRAGVSGCGAAGFVNQ